MRNAGISLPKLRSGRLRGVSKCTAAAVLMSVVGLCPVAAIAAVDVLVKASDQRGRPVAGAKVCVNDRRCATTSPAGETLVAGVPPGPIVLTVMTPDGRFVTFEKRGRIPSYGPFSPVSMRRNRSTMEYRVRLSTPNEFFSGGKKYSELDSYLVKGPMGSGRSAPAAAGAPHRPPSPPSRHGASQGGAGPQGLACKRWAFGRHDYNGRQLRLFGPFPSKAACELERSAAEGRGAPRGTIHSFCQCLK